MKLITLKIDAKGLGWSFDIFAYYEDLLSPKLMTPRVEREGPAPGPRGLYHK